MLSSLVTLIEFRFIPAAYVKLHHQTTTDHQNQEKICDDEDSTNQILIVRCELSMPANAISEAFNLLKCLLLFEGKRNNHHQVNLYVGHNPHDVIALAYVRFEPGINAAADSTNQHTSDELTACSRVNCA